MKVYFIRSSESTIGDELYKVFIPDGVPRHIIDDAFTMAERYSNYYNEMCYTDINDIEETFDGDINRFDEYFDEIVIRCVENRLLNGQEVFNFYIEEVMGWALEPLRCDFAYEW